MPCRSCSPCHSLHYNKTSQCDNHGETKTCLLTWMYHLICQGVDRESWWYLHSYSKKGEIVVCISTRSHILEIGKEQVQVIHFRYLFNELWNVFKKEFWSFIIKNVEINPVSATCNKSGTIVQSSDNQWANAMYSSLSATYALTSSRIRAKTNARGLTVSKLPRGIYQPWCEHVSKDIGEIEQEKLTCNTRLGFNWVASTIRAPRSTLRYVSSCALGSLSVILNSVGRM